MSSTQIHKVIYWLYALSIIICMSCSREPVLKRNGFPDKGEIFVSIYINNNKENGLSIFGKDLLNMGVTAFADSGNGYYALPLLYNAKNYEYKAKVDQYTFKSNRIYRFKVLSSVLKDSIMFEKSLPEPFTLQTFVSYPNPGEYICKMVLSDASLERSKFVHDMKLAHFDDTITRPIFFGGFGNAYAAKDLPWIKSFGNNYSLFQELVDLNGGSLYSGVRLPFAATGCDYIPYDNFQWQAQLIRFTKEDYEYIHSMYENVDNYGNPFFLPYQAKHLIYSKKRHIFGKAVSSYLTSSPPGKVLDLSPIILKVFIKNQAGQDFIGDPKYAIHHDVVGQPRLEFRETSANYVCVSENMLNYQYGCSEFAPNRHNVTIRFIVFNKLSGKSSVTNTITIDLDDLPKDITLTIP